MKKYSRLSSVAVVMGALRVKNVARNIQSTVSVDSDTKLDPQFALV